MKKYAIYGLAIIALVGAIGYFYYSFSPTTLAKAESDFGTSDIGKISKVRITKAGNDTLLLTLKDKKWRVNNRYIVNEDPFTQLFAALQKMQVKAPVPESANDNVIKELLEKYTYVQLFENGSDKPFKAFYVGGPTLDNKGTYMLLEIDGKTASKPYVVSVPGYNGYLSGRFNTTEENWRSRWISKDDGTNITEAKITYHRKPENSFSLTRNESGELAVSSPTKTTAKQPNQNYLEQYMTFLEALSLESYENNNSIKDTILKTQPYCTVTIRHKDGSKSETVIYYMPINPHSMKQFDEFGVPLIYDVERYYATINDGKDFVMIQYYVWGKALRSYDDFFRKKTSTLSAGDQ